MLDAEVAHMLGYDYVLVAETPAFDSGTHKLEPAARVPAGPNAFTRGWRIVPLSGAELDERAAKYAQDLVQAKASKRQEINDARLRANRTSFAFAGKEIAVDDVSRSDIDGVSDQVLLTGQFPVGFPGAWKAMDNSYVAIPDVDTWRTFVTAMTTQGAVNFGRAQQRKAEIDAATTIAQVEAVAWDDAPAEPEQGE
ncbi:MAG TPA: DUF4376 domain-containing protein [Ramlibacter sp.]|nr:DUF4376 domain-containing protein [Ramlibacter sp.]